MRTGWVGAVIESVGPSEWDGWRPGSTPCCTDGCPAGFVIVTIVSKLGYNVITYLWDLLI